jgi:DNA replication and repair protein RecF
VYLKHLSLTNFRNFVRLEVDFPLQPVVLAGDNAQGKTNLLEAIYYLASTRSSHAESERELMNWDAQRDDQAFTRLGAVVERDAADVRLEIVLANLSAAVPTLRRTLKVNGGRCKVEDFIGMLRVVLFEPHDLDLVDGPPTLRRRFIDRMLCQIDPCYSRALTGYTQVLTRRNHLLRLLRDSHNAADQIAFWDEKLVEHGTYLMLRRQKAIDELNALSTDLHPSLSGTPDPLKLVYRPSMIPRQDAAFQMLLPLELPPPRLTEEKQLASEFAAQLEAIRDQEIARGVSLLGPHRDDVRFRLGDVDMNLYASRGQQRTIALTLKLAEMQLIHIESGEEPLLLLDDVLSELDAARRHYLIEMIRPQSQVILTTTELASVGLTLLDNARCWRIESGRLVP